MKTATLLAALALVSATARGAEATHADTTKPKDTAPQAAATPKTAATASKQATAPKPASTFKPTPFKLACDKPSFAAIGLKDPLEVDEECGADGSGTGPEAAQNEAKNNFCATGTPREITTADLIKLQAKVEKNPKINFGDLNSPTRKKGPTTDRAALRKLGEGQLVTLKAYVLIARQEGGESVNCGDNVPKHAAFHDIHISLVDSPDVPKENECSSVVAEMSPHHRPAEWNHGNVDKVSTAKKLVRVTGPLYFDSSHMPCANGQHVRSNPKRASLWEIHPVYKFEVCTGDCDGKGEWTPLEQWDAPRAQKGAE